jgi:catechol 2,3-dioxygenase-like lactoylglutathione lyase family enzyme
MTCGIHHVTVIAGRARRNLDFYTRVPRLRLVKKTVDFDTSTHHFCCGDKTGRPSTIMTFFPWEHAAPPVRAQAEGSRSSATCFGGLAGAAHLRLGEL